MGRRFPPEATDASGSGLPCRDLYWRLRESRILNPSGFAGRTLDAECTIAPRAPLLPADEVRAGE